MGFLYDGRTGWFSFEALELGQSVERAARRANGVPRAILDQDVEQASVAGVPDTTPATRSIYLRLLLEPGFCLCPGVADLPFSDPRLSCSDRSSGATYRLLTGWALARDGSRCVPSGYFQPLGQSKSGAASMEQLADKPVTPECGGFFGMGVGFQQVLLGWHPIFGCTPMRTREAPVSPGKNRVGAPKRKAFG